MFNLIISAFALVFVVFAYQGAPLWAWTAYAGAIMYGLKATPVAWGIFAAVAIIFNTPVRRMISGIVMNILIKMKFIPKISDTELQALKAGDVWVERELFSGSPDYKKMRATHYPKLTEEEQAFMDGRLKNFVK